MIRQPIEAFQSFAFFFVVSEEGNKIYHPRCFNNQDDCLTLMQPCDIFWGSLHSTWSSLIRVSLSRTWTYVDIRQQVKHVYPSRTVTLKVNTTDAQGRCDHDDTDRFMLCFHHKQIKKSQQIKTLVQSDLLSLLWPRPLFPKCLNVFLLQLHAHFFTMTMRTCRCVTSKISGVHKRSPPSWPNCWKTR